MYDSKFDRKAVADTWLKSYRENPDFIDKKLAQEIERNRKGFCKLRFVREDGTPIVGAKVTVTQDTHDFKYGANIFMLDEFKEEKDNAAYRNMFYRYFNLATVPFYWKSLEPEKGKPRYAADSPKIYRRPAPELCVQYCEEHDIDAKLHCLIYDSNTPDWLMGEGEEEIISQYHRHLDEIAKRYTGRLCEFEVINETLLEHRWKDKTVLSDRRDLIEWAFALCRRHLPNETLVINESNPILRAAVEDYRAAYFMQIERALLLGATIDKVGLQHHVFTGATCATEEAYLKEVLAGDSMVDVEKIWQGLKIYSELNLPLEITELTIPTFGPTEEDEELQAQLLKNLYTVFFACPNMDTVVYWNTVDSYAFDCGPKWNENNCRGGLFRPDLTPKKAATMLYDLFHRVWHTDLTLVTDRDGYVEFDGFYGNYTAELDGAVCTFGIHKNECPITEIEL